MPASHRSLVLPDRTRRHVIALMGAASAALPGLPLFAPAVLGQARPRLVVIGGGAGGATVARTVNRESPGAIEVTLVEPQQSYTTPFFSNLHVGGLRDLRSITFTYDGVRREGVRVVHDAAVAVERDRRVVTLAAGDRLSYDRLVVAPGIDLKWDSVPGYSEAAATAMPHAWRLGAEVEALVRKLDAVQDGDTIVMVAPPNPSRCPTAPYERVSMFAHVLKSKGYGKASVVVLDQKPSFPEQPLFQDLWESRYPGMIEWQDPGVHGGIKRLDPATGEVTTDLGTYQATLANIIPAQVAGRIARDAGLA